jgi:glycosyltransferase involved in cell wall biosynthesis
VTPTRVLHCLWNGNVGGAERAVWLLAREQLADPDLAPALLFAQDTGPYAERARAAGLPVVGLGLPSGRSLGRIPAAAEKMRGFDIHHFHTADPLLMLASGLCPGTRRVYTHRGGTTDYSRAKRVKHGLAGVMMRSFFHGFSGNTAHGADCGSQLYRIDRNRFSVTYNGIDPNDLAPARAPESVRSELGLAAGDFVIGTAANLKAWKRIDRLVHAVAAIGDPSVRLLIVGDGVDRARLESVARGLGIEDRVLFSGLVLHVPDYLQVMDAFCLPSTGLESFGNATVEAMFLGLPTIVFADGGGMVEHIEDGVTGFVVSDQHELEECLRRLRDDAELRLDVGSRARTAVTARYTPGVSAASYRALYASVLPSPSAAATRKDVLEDRVA